MGPQEAAENDYIQYLDRGDGVAETESVKKMSRFNSLCTLCRVPGGVLIYQARKSHPMQQLQLVSALH